MSSSARHLYEFGPFRLDTAERTLLRSGLRVPLTPKAYEVLLVLVRRAGHIVEKDELMRDVWADAFVEEGNLTHHIFTLRKTLGEGGGGEYIETIPRRGYRFVSPVQEVRDESIERAERPTRLVRPSADDKATATIAAKNENLTVGTMGYKKGAVLIAVLLVFIVAALSLYKYFDRESRFAPNSQKMEVRKLTSNSRATTAAISPDGKYVVYSKEDAGRQSLWLKQVATLSEVQIVPPEEVKYYGGTFTYDGSYLYYVMEEKNRSSGVYQIAAVGGSPRKICEGLETSVTLSPDGGRLAFVRLNQGQSETSLWVVKVDGGGERKLATRKGSEWFDHGVGIGPAWSPDGRVIACSVGGTDEGRQYHGVVGVDVESGEQKLITTHQRQRWEEGGQVAWRADGSGLVLVGDGQIWQLSYPGGEARKITNDANTYIGISAMAGSGALVTVQLDNESSIWVMPEGDTEKAQPIASGRREGYHGLSWTPDGKIVYTSVAGGNLDLWLMATDGTHRKQLTANSGWNYAPSVSSDGRYIVFASTRTGTTHIWRIDIDGSNPQQLTNGPEERWPECSPDGKWVVYVSFAASTVQNVWKVPMEGGNPVPVTNLISHLPVISPNGKLIAFRSGNARDQPLKISVMSFADGSLVKAFDVEPTTIMTGDYKVLRWTPDGGGLAYLDTRTGVANIWIRPLDGGPERQLTDFKSEHMFRFDWSRDGKYLAVTRGAMMKDVILISGFE